MLAPGPYYYGQPMTIDVCFEDQDGALVDPDTVTFKLISPIGTESSYVYLTDGELARDDAGMYYIYFTPQESGRWFYRWESTGTGKASVREGNFLIEYSPFYYGQQRAYRDC